MLRGLPDLVGHPLAEIAVFELVLPGLQAGGWFNDTAAGWRTAAPPE
jgi:hypothetical protein